MKLCFIGCLLVSFVFSFAQGKKDIQKYKIKSISESFENINGDGTSVKDVQDRYDKNGNNIEKISYDKAGQLKQRTISKYNNLLDKVEEIVLDANDKQIERTVYKYDSFGEKYEEEKYDEKNELISKLVYSFNNKHLKTERKTFDGQGNLVQIKKYVYEY